jgi:hypothetical protein
VYVNRGGLSGPTVAAEDRPWLYQLDAATGATVTRATYEAQWGSDERPTIAGTQLVTDNGYEGGMGSWSVPGLAANWAVEGSIYRDPEAAVSATSIYAYGSYGIDESYTKVYDRATGEVQATLTHPLAWTFDPVVSASGRVLVSVGEVPGWPGWRGVAAYGPDHALLWSTATSTDVVGKAVGNGVVAVATRTGLCLLDEATGAVRWTWGVPPGVAPLLTRTIILTRTHAFVAMDGGVYGASVVYAVNLVTGQPEWSYRNDQQDENASTRLEMALGGGRLIIGHDSFVKAFDLFGAADDTAVTNEDRRVRIRVLANDTDPDGGRPTVAAAGPAAHGTVTRNADGTVTYKPAADYNGPDSFTYTVKSRAGYTTTANVRVTVRPVNDAPTFTPGPAQAVAEDSGPATVPGWATNMSPGPPDEAGQGLTFLVATTRPRMFAVPPAVGPDGTLTFTPAANANGKVRVIVRLRDDGGRAYGGRDTSRRTFTITVTPVPDVARVVVNRGAAQRSRVTDVAVTFDSVVDPALLSEAFGLTRADGTAVGAVSVTSSVSLGRTTARLEFSGNGTEAGSLADGLWTLRVRADRVRTADGAVLADDYIFTLHRLFGDSDGDGDVDQLDELRFNAAYGSRSNQPRYRAYLDWDQDVDPSGLRDIDGLDREQFLGRLGTSL